MAIDETTTWDIGLRPGDVVYCNIDSAAVGAGPMVVDIWTASAAPDCVVRLAEEGDETMGDVKTASVFEVVVVRTDGDGERSLVLIPHRDSNGVDEEREIGIILACDEDQARQKLLVLLGSTNKIVSSDDVEVLVRPFA